MPEGRPLNATSHSQQFPSNLLIRIQDGVCATCALRFMCKGPNARIYGYSGCDATIRPRPPSRSCGRLFPELVRSHHRVTYRSSLLAPSQMRRSVSEAGWQLLPPHNERNSRVVPTPQDGPPKKSFCILLSSLTASAAARRANVTCRGRDSIHLTSGLKHLGTPVSRRSGSFDYPRISVVFRPPPSDLECGRSRAVAGRRDLAVR